MDTQVIVKGSMVKVVNGPLYNYIYKVKDDRGKRVVVSVKDKDILIKKCHCVPFRKGH